VVNRMSLKALRGLELVHMKVEVETSKNYEGSKFVIGIFNFHTCVTRYKTHKMLTKSKFQV
jgi:hypothetical protein